MSKVRRGDYIRIDWEVLDDYNLTPTEYFVYSHLVKIASKLGSSNVADTTQQQLTKATGLTRQTMSKVDKSLTKKGLITIQKRRCAKWTRNVYILLPVTKNRGYESVRNTTKEAELVVTKYVLCKTNLHSILTRKLKLLTSNKQSINKYTFDTLKTSKLVYKEETNMKQQNLFSKPEKTKTQNSILDKNGRRKIKEFMSRYPQIHKTVTGTAVPSNSDWSYGSAKQALYRLIDLGLSEGNFYPELHDMLEARKHQTSFPYLSYKMIIEHSDIETFIKEGKLLHNLKKRKKHEAEVEEKVITDHNIQI